MLIFLIIAPPQKKTKTLFVNVCYIILIKVNKIK